jgi:hypothetical protein
VTAFQVGFNCTWAYGQSVPKSLLGIPLSFVEIGKRPNFGLNSIVVVPRVEDGGRFVRLTIERGFLTREFLRAFTSGPRGSEEHAFFSYGVEAVLRKRELILTIHPGVALHLRDGTPTDPAYRTFASSSVTIKLAEFEGKAYVTTSPDEVRSKANDVFVALFGKRGKEERVLKLKDGSALIIGQPTSEDDFPPKFMPRVE